MAAIFLYIYLELLKLNFGSVFDFGAFGFGDLEIVAKLKVADDFIDEIGGESFNFGVKLFGAAIIETARSLDFVFYVL